MDCKRCNGVGSVAVVNNGRWPGLPSLIAAECPDCQGLGVIIWPEVTPEQVAKLEEIVKPEFETGEWETVESETDPERAERLV